MLPSLDGDCCSPQVPHLNHQDWGHYAPTSPSLTCYPCSISATTKPVHRDQHRHSPSFIIWPQGFQHLEWNSATSRHLIAPHLIAQCSWSGSRTKSSRLAAELEKAFVNVYCNAWKLGPPASHRRRSVSVRTSLAVGFQEGSVCFWSAVE